MYQKRIPMSIANSQRLLLCIILSLITSVIINASVAIDTPSYSSPTKEIIIISYDDIASTNITSIVSYVESLYQESNDIKVVIKNYGNADKLAPEASLTQVVKEITDSAVSADDIQVKQEVEVDAAAYFTITVGTSEAVQ